MNNKIYFGVVILAIMLPCVRADYTNLNISVGESWNVDCNTTDAAYNLSCIGICDRQCTVDATIPYGQVYQYQQGVCDLKFQCAENNETQYITQSFPGTVGMSKDNETINISIDIQDPDGNDYLTKNWLINFDEIQTVVYPFNFTCPAELPTNINLNTCLPYLTEAFKENGSLTFQISLLNQMCFNELTNCRADANANDQQTNDYIAKYSQTFNDWENERFSRIDCEAKLDAGDPNSTVGSLTYQLANLQKDIRRSYVTREEYNFLMWVAIILGVIVAILFITMFLGVYR